MTIDYKREVEKIISMMFDAEVVECQGCGYPTYVRWDRRYNGYLGFCSRCDSVWRES